MASKYTQRDVKQYVSSSNEVPFYIPPGVLAELLTKVRSEITTSTQRAIFVVTFEGNIPKHFHLHRNEPNRDNNDKFSKDVAVAWDNYVIGKTIPIIMCRLTPTPFTALIISNLPWNTRVKKYCLRCGDVSHEIAKCAR